MQFLKIVACTCNLIPRDADGYLGFRINNGRVYHLLHTPRGVEIVSVKCEDCVLYKLLTAGHLAGAPTVRNGKIKIVVSNTKYVKRIIATGGFRILRVEVLRRHNLFLTPRQRDVLMYISNGHNLTSLANTYGVSKTAVYKLFKKALRKVAELI